MASCLLQFFLVSLIFFSLDRLVVASPATNEPDIHDIMPSYGLPPGIIPYNVISYTLQESGNFVITLSTPCYVQFDRLVYYGTDIRGKLSYGAVSEISGIQAKKAFFWLSITGIETSEEGEKIKFFVGPFSETFPVTRFAEIPACGRQVSMRNPLKQVPIYDFSI